MYAVLFSLHIGFLIISVISTPGGWIVPVFCPNFVSSRLVFCFSFFVQALVAKYLLHTSLEPQGSTEFLLLKIHVWVVH